MQKARGRAVLRHGSSTACRHAVSGSISLPSQGFFSPFPHGTGSLSVAGEYLALRDGPRGFPRGFTCPAVLGRELGRQGVFAYRAITFFGRAFQLTSANPLFCNSLDRSGGPEPSHNTDDATLLSLTRHRFGLFPGRSPLLGESLLLSLPRGTEMVHFPPLASATYSFSRG